jgi:putative phage-type endonuclease
VSFDDLNIVDCLQGSEEWFANRIGLLTSSRIADAIRKAKRESTGELQCRADLRLDLAVERVTRKPMEHFVSKWMERGAEMEPMARAAYELRTDTRVRQVGFILHPSLAWAGCSPDGLLTDGLTEFKCPKSNTHAEYLLGECVPDLYIPQILWQMACCPGYQWCDFVSYCPDFPEPLDLFICRLPRDDKRIAAMEAEAEKFLAEVATTVERLKEGLEGMLRKSLQVSGGKSNNGASSTAVAPPAVVPMPPESFEAQA